MVQCLHIPSVTSLCIIFIWRLEQVFRFAINSSQVGNHFVSNEQWMLDLPMYLFNIYLCCNLTGLITKWRDISDNPLPSPRLPSPEVAWRPQIFSPFIIFQSLTSGGAVLFFTFKMPSIEWCKLWQRNIWNKVSKIQPTASRSCNKILTNKYKTVFLFISRPCYPTKYLLHSPLHLPLRPSSYFLAISVSNDNTRKI